MASNDENGCEELARMNLNGSGDLGVPWGAAETVPPGAMPEKYGRKFMALLDMCHFLVDHIIQDYNFPDLQAASTLRCTNSAAAGLLTAQMYSYWYSAPMGKGVFEMLLDWTKQEKEARTCMAREYGRKVQATSFGASLHPLVEKECAQWPLRRLTGSFFFGAEDADGAALLVDEKLEKVYRVLGISTSVGNLIRSLMSGRNPIGTTVKLTLLPWLGVITYDGTVRCEPPPGATRSALVELAEKAQADGTLVTVLPTVADAPLLSKRIEIKGLQSKSELNGRFGIASAFDDEKGRYVVALEDGSGSFKLKPDNVLAAPKANVPRAPRVTLGENEIAIQKRLKALPAMDDCWVFRRFGYTEKENPNNIVVIMNDHGLAVGQLISKKLEPTAAEYLAALEESCRGRRKPNMIAVDEQGAVERLQKILKPAGIIAGYYPPPSDEELSAMGVTGCK